VFVKSGNFWKLVYTTEGMTEDVSETNDINMNTFTYSGIKIEMHEGNGVELDGETEKVVYGL